MSGDFFALLSCYFACRLRIITLEGFNLSSSECNDSESYPSDDGTEGIPEYCSYENEVIEDCYYIGNKDLKEAEINPCVSRIGRYAFFDCPNLEKVIIPDTVKEIGDYAFPNCRNLEIPDLPEGIKLGRDVFKKSE